MLSRLSRRLTAAAILFFAAALAAAAAHAQTAPYVHGAVIGTSPVQVLATDPQRRKIFLFNPNASAAVAFCPAGPNRDTGAPLVCAVNGAGSITLQPGQGVMLDGAVPQGPPLSMSSAWNGVASAGGSTYTVIDFE
jgi:hypothetical protein